MGAEFVFAVCEMEASKEEAYANARHLSMPERCEHTATFVEHMLMAGEWASSFIPLSEHLFKYLTVCIDEVYDAGNRRDCGSFYVDKRKFYITGGMSWGDQPTDVFNSFSVCETLGLTLKQPNLEVWE